MISWTSRVDGSRAGYVIEEMQQARPDRLIRFEAIGDLRGAWDAARVEQVISNLVANAVTHGTGEVHAMARSDGDEILTTVHNNGCPIPAEVLPVVFEPFLRADPDNAAVRPDSLGLGLYIASEIVHAHGATISVNSTTEAGTTFTIRWRRRASLA